MKDIILLPLFPSLLLKAKLYYCNIEEIKNDIIQKHEGYVKSKTINDEMRADGQNAFTNLEKDKKYFGLKKEIEYIVDNTLQEIYGYSEISSYVCSMWSTCCCPGESGAPHYHSNSFYSGVYYLFENTPSNLEFYNPNNEKIALNVLGNMTEFNQYNCGKYAIVPEEYDLIFFPSYLYHKVLRNNSNQVRYSLGFNVYLKGDLNLPTGNLKLY